MTMHYAKTLRETHEREFLRYRKITADAEDLDIDPRDLFALLELDKRTDRVLPNGLCMLPPRQVCNRGNACLTCDKFATDATYLPEHEQQLTKLTDLIAQRQEVFAAKTGQAMSTTNVWLAQRLAEQRAHSSGSSPCSPATTSAPRTPSRAPGAPRAPPTTRSADMGRGNPENLRAAAQRKHQATTARARRRRSTSWSAPTRWSRSRPSRAPPACPSTSYTAHHCEAASNSSAPRSRPSRRRRGRSRLPRRRRRATSFARSPPSSPTSKDATTARRPS